MDRVGTETTEISRLTIPQPNCDGTLPVENTTTRSLAVEHVVDAGSEVEVSADGTVSVPGVASVGLGAKVASRYGLSYGTTVTYTQAIKVGALAGANMEHEIRQFEIWDNFLASVQTPTGTLEIPFRFRTGFSLELTNSRNIGCPTAKGDLAGAELYDEFDDACIDNLRWDLIPQGPTSEGAKSEGDKTDDSNCWITNLNHKIAETDAFLVYDSTGRWWDGILRDNQKCTFDSVFITLDSFSLSGSDTSGYVGFIVDNPYGSPSRVSVWLSARSRAAGARNLRAIANEEWDGILDHPSQRTIAGNILASDVQGLTLGFELSDGRVFASAAGERVDLNISTFTKPYRLRIVIGNISDSTVSATIDSVYLGWDQNRTGALDCPLP